MTPRYAIICAAHEGNAGMHSVDRAAKHFFTSRGADHTLFVAQQAKGRMQDYTLLSAWNQLRDYTHVVYWGDFLNNPFYGYSSFPKRSMRWGLAESKQAAIAQWKSLFVPENPGAGKKLYSVGQNFQHYFEHNDVEFGPIFDRLEDFFEALMVRDTFSFQNLSRMIEFRDITKVLQGLDCAFLQAPAERAETVQEDPGEEGTFVYYFRRSKLDDPRRLVTEIEAATGYRGVELKSWIPLKRGAWDDEFEGLKKLIGSAQFVVSDTYHVCVNAMHSRVPVIGVGRQSTEQIGTIGDFKKKVLFEMFDLGHLYHEIPAGQAEAETRRQMVKTVEAALEARTEGADTYYMVEARTQQFARELERVLELV